MNSLRDTLRISMTGLVLAALTLSGCSDTDSSHEMDHADHADHADHGSDDHAGHDHGTDEADHLSNDHDEVRTDVYEGVLGELTFLPETGDPKQHPKIHHMQIPGFKRQDGTVAMSPDGVSGMKSMTMEFPLAEGVSADGLSVGDKIRFTFRVNWGGRVAWEVTSIEKMDPSTEIDFSNVKSDAEP